MKKDMLNFDSDPLTCDPALFPAKNSPSSAKSSRIFPKKGSQDDYLLCLISAIFMGKLEVKVGPKVQTLGCFFFHKNSNRSKNVFVCSSTISGENFGKIGTYLGE